jgi:hypothetical protein
VQWRAHRARRLPAFHDELDFEAGQQDFVEHPMTSSS